MPGFRSLPVRCSAVIGLVLASSGNAMGADSIPLQQADEHYRAGRFGQAERMYREAVAAERDPARAWEMLGTIALWRNDLVSADAHFANADRHKSWLARRWPLNIQANARRALVHVRAGRTREAADRLRRAAGPLPFGPLKELKVRARQLAQFDGKAPYRIEGPADSILPFLVTDPLPVVRLVVNGAPPAEFAIDTGGEGLILDCAFARTIGAQIVGELAQEYAGGRKSATGYGKVEMARLGDITVRDVPVSCIDVQPIGRSVFGGRAIQGVVGTGLLMQFLTTLDYPRGQLILRQYGAAPTVPQASELQHSFPMWLVETHLMFVEGSVNHLEPALMFVDTGLAGAGFHASKEILTRAGVAMDWSKAGFGAGGAGLTKGVGVSVAQVSLGRGDSAIRKRDLKGIAFEQDLSIFKGALGFNIGGLISHQFFRDHAVTFDFRNMRLIVEN